MGTWAPLVPYAKSRADLDEAQLGVLLLCLGFGSMLTMPFSSVLATRFGCRAVLTLSSAVLALCLPLMATLSNQSSLAVTLFVFGASLGLLDVTVNLHATIVEKASGRSMMSGFHGMYSLGGLIGAALVSGLLSLGQSPLLAALCSVALIFLLILGFARHLLNYSVESPRAKLAWPRGKILLIGILCFITFMAEGAVLDWGALFLKTLRGFPASRAGLGYASFAVAMTIGRIFGDRVVDNLGGKRILIGGGLGAVAGFGLVVSVPFGWVSLLGFTLVGLGASNVVPVLFTQVGRQTAMPVGAAIATITTLGYAGILLGPAAIGFVAHASSLVVALGLVALALLAVPFATKTVMSED